MAQERCEWLKEDGIQCGGWKITGDRFCFSHKRGESGVIKTQFGWHVIEITDVKK